MNDNFGWKPMDTSQQLTLSLVLQAAWVTGEYGVESFGGPPTDPTGAYQTEFGPCVEKVAAKLTDDDEWPWAVFLKTTGERKDYFRCSCDAEGLCAHALAVLFTCWSARCDYPEAWR